MSKFVYKPKPTAAGLPKGKLGRHDLKGAVASTSASEAVNAALNDAESRAERKREWAEATRISERRHALLARLRNGEVTREAIDPAELLILDEVARVEREQTSATRGRIMSKVGTVMTFSGFPTLLAGMASVSNACMRVAAHPTALKIVIAAGGAGLMVAGVLLLIWGANRWFL